MPRTDVFVLVHGAFHGGWCWSRVVADLQSRGKRAHAPTLTGMGDRHHLLSPDITLQTWIDDVANLLVWEELEDVTLVGHSFAGTVIGAVAERCRARIRNLVFLDSLIVTDGQKPFDVVPPDVADARRRAAAASPGGLSLPPPPPESFGVVDPHDVAWVSRRLTPHPVATYESVCRLEKPLGSGLPVTYVACTAPDYPPVLGSRKRAKTLPGWTHVDFPAGHDCMVSAPAGLVDLLMRLRQEAPRSDP